MSHFLIITFRYTQSPFNYVQSITVVLTEGYLHQKEKEWLIKEQMLKKNLENQNNKMHQEQNESVELKAYHKEREIQWETKSA